MGMHNTATAKCDNPDCNVTCEVTIDLMRAGENTGSPFTHVAGLRGWYRISLGYAGWVLACRPSCVEVISKTNGYGSSGWTRFS